MATKPILFNTEMVQAIKAGRKTQTRRIIKPQPVWDGISCFHISKYGCWAEGRNDRIFSAEDNWPINTGDILWVRETWYDMTDNNGDVFYRYRADLLPPDNSADWRWKPSIHMPKEAARIFLRVKDVRVERLRDISCHDAAAEGVDDVEPCDYDELLCNYCPLEDNEKGVHNYGSGPVMCEGVRCKEAFDAWTEEFIAEFSTIWNSTIKPADLDVYGWEANPWVWVIEFELCEKPEGWC